MCDTQCDKYTLCLKKNTVTSSFAFLSHFYLKVPFIFESWHKTFPWTLLKVGQKYFIAVLLVLWNCSLLVFFFLGAQTLEFFFKCLMRWIKLWECICAISNSTTWSLPIRRQCGWFFGETEHKNRTKSSLLIKQSWQLALRCPSQMQQNKELLNHINNK